MGFVFGSLTVDLLAALIIICTSVYFYATLHTYAYWRKRGVKFIEPTFPFGNFGPTFRQKLSLGEVVQKYYNSTTEAFVGIFVAFNPTLVICDPELARTILIKDFQHFHDRPIVIDEEQDPLSGHLFSLGGKKWDNLRAKLSPTFTSGKLKAMFPTLVACGDPLKKFMEQAASREETVEVREILAQYTTNVIASVAFGIDIDCIADPDTDFRKYGRKVFEPTVKNALGTITQILFPQLMYLIKIKSVAQEVEDFIISMVKGTLDYREANNVVRKDFFQLMIQLRNTGSVQLDDQWETKIVNDSQKKLTINEIAAQAFIFWLAGFETSSTTMGFCLYELAKNQDIQDRVRKEIDNVLAEHKGEVTYESINDLKLLELCIDETLRLYPPVFNLIRKCTKEWKLPGTDIVIEKGVGVAIPAFAMQRDPKYYPNPEQFQPERFNAENSAGKTFVNRPYMPFGEGPRVCIGQRLGKMQTKVGLLLLLQNFKFNLSGNTLQPLKISPKNVLFAPVGGLELKVSRR